MGNFFFDIASKNKGILPAAKACYIIAAENLNAVIIHSTVKPRTTEIIQKQF